MEAWLYQHGVRLEFIRPGRPVENGCIEFFNGRLRDECLDVETFFDLGDSPRQARALAAGLQPDQVA
jgi:putative transposase